MFWTNEILRDLSIDGFRTDMLYYNNPQYLCAVPTKYLSKVFKKSEVF